VPSIVFSEVATVDVTQAIFTAKLVPLGEDRDPVDDGVGIAVEERGHRAGETRRARR
jgi:hypothetical protein